MGKVKKSTKMVAIGMEISLLGQKMQLEIYIVQIMKSLEIRFILLIKQKTI